MVVQLNHKAETLSLSPCCFLHTGKSLLLMLQVQDVDIVSGSSNSPAASLMMQHQLQMTLHADPTASPAPGTVWFHQYDFGGDSDVDRAVSDLSLAVHGGKLCILVDEMMTNACCLSVCLSLYLSLSLSLSVCVTNGETALYVTCSGVSRIVKQFYMWQ